MSRWMVRLGILALLIGGVVLMRGPGEGDLSAQEKAGKVALPADLARVPGKMVGFISFRPADLWNGDLGKSVRTRLGKAVDELTGSFEKDMGLAPAEIERVTMVIPRADPGGMEPLIYITTTKAIDKTTVRTKRLKGGGQERKSGDETYYTDDHKAIVFLDARTMILGTAGEIQTLLETPRAKLEGNLTPALRLAASGHAAVVAVNPAAMAHVTEDLPSDLEPFKALLKAKIGTVTMDLKDKSRVQMRITFAGAGDLKEGSVAIERARLMGVRFLGEMIKMTTADKALGPIVEVMKQTEKEMKGLKWKREGTTLAATVEVKISIDPVAMAAADALQRARIAASRMQGSNNLKQIGLAMHNYLDSNGSFPPAAVFDKDGKALLSWRVLILPFIEQDALYKEFKLDEPWDSPHNKKLLARMPKTYEVPGGKPKNKHGTFYQVFYGKNAAFEGKAGVGIADFTDGTSNTILMAESATDVPWTKPEDIPFDAAKKVPKLGGISKGGFQTLFADGSVRFISEMVEEKTLKAMITRNGGEVINE